MLFKLLGPFNLLFRLVQANLCRDVVTVSGSAPVRQMAMHGCLQVLSHLLIVHQGGVALCGLTEHHSCMSL